jgi:hypothetical protein
MRNCRQLAVIIFLTVSWVFPLWSGYSGKIAGTITEKTTAKYFQDVRVAAEGLSVSTFSDARRRYVILAVPLGNNRSLNQGFGENYASGKVSVQGDLTIRGGEGDNILFMVDGITMRDPRNNEPLAKIPLSPVEEISVVPNGFNAEYGQVQSSIVHVITREGGKQGYSGIFKYTMPRLPPNTGTDAVYVISRVHTLICCVPFLIPRLNKYEENHHVPLYYINPNLIFSSNYYLPCSGSC